MSFASALIYRLAVDSGVSNFIESSFESSFELLDFILDETLLE